MTTTYIQLGTNIGDRKYNLLEATLLIENRCGFIIKSSSIYETAAWGVTDQPNFYNQIVAIKTLLSAELLLTQLLSIEQDLGRVRAEKYGPRIIDLDIIFYGNEIIELPHLQIPHQHIANRKFVLIPLAEIVPNKIHPKLNCSIAALLLKSPDELEVKKVN